MQKKSLNTYFGFIFFYLNCAAMPALATEVPSRRLEYHCVGTVDPSVKLQVAVEGSQGHLEIRFWDSKTQKIVDKSVELNIHHGPSKYTDNYEWHNLEAKDEFGFSIGIFRSLVESDQTSLQPGMIKLSIRPVNRNFWFSYGISCQ